MPKILLEDSIPRRTVLREPQLVEQLVEVPTVVSYSSLQQQLVEQNVDIPVPGGGRHSREGLQGSSQDPVRDDIWVVVMSEEQAYYWNRLTRTSHWVRPPGRRPGWVPSIDGLFVHIETQEVVQELYACDPG